MKMKVFNRTKSLKTIDETTSTDFPLPSPSPRNKSRKTLASQEIKTLQDSELYGGDHSPTAKKAFAGLRFHRNLSISSSMQQMSAVKKAFSMKRSPSISERYCRIHDQRVALAFSSDDDEPIGSPSPRLESLIEGNKSDHGRKTIVKSCKRVLGL